MEFLLLVSYQFDGEFFNDDVISGIVGKRCNFSGAGACVHGCDRRELGWYLETMEECTAAKAQLEESGIDDLVVSIREKITHE